MAVAIESIARELNLTPDELGRRSLAAFLEREIRATQMDIADLQDRYHARDATDLSAKIKAGAVHSHPAWEDCIEWQSLEAHLERLNRWQAELG